jgi:hypothetical protein
MSEVDDLSFVIDDGVLTEDFMIRRSTGTFELGGWVTVFTDIKAQGVVSVARPQDLEMIPEADRITGTMVFHTVPRIYVTEVDTDPTDFGVQKVSDILLWSYLRWRVMNVFPYPNRKYWKAFAVRMAGN